MSGKSCTKLLEKSKPCSAHGSCSAGGRASGLVDLIVWWYCGPRFFLSALNSLGLFLNLFPWVQMVTVIHNQDWTVFFHMQHLREGGWIPRKGPPQESPRAPQRFMAHIVSSPSTPVWHSFWKEKSVAMVDLVHSAGVQRTAEIQPLCWTRDSSDETCQMFLKCQQIGLFGSIIALSRTIKVP